MKRPPRIESSSLHHCLCPRALKVTIPIVCVGGRPLGVVLEVELMTIYVVTLAIWDDGTKTTFGILNGEWGALGVKRICAVKISCGKKG
jgi:hypothetical protein